MHEYEGVRRVCYPDYSEGEEYGATFVPVCAKCGRFVRADPSMGFEYVRRSKMDVGYVKPKEPNATCKKCGRVAMLFEGYV